MEAGLTQTNPLQIQNVPRCLGKVVAFRCLLVDCVWLELWSEGV